MVRVPGLLAGALFIATDVSRVLLELRDASVELAPLDADGLMELDGLEEGVGRLSAFAVTPVLAPALLAVALVPSPLDGDEEALCEP